MVPMPPTGWLVPNRKRKCAQGACNNIVAVAMMIMIMMMMMIIFSGYLNVSNFWEATN